MTRNLSATDFLPLDQYAPLRLAKRKEIVELKRNRRIFIGPFATASFECWDTMWYQIQEMLYIEKGGDEQLASELIAYAPLVPNGRELVATLMFEIPDERMRQRILANLGGVERTMSLRFSGESVSAMPEGDIERTNEEGKTSSVHFLHFPFTAAQIALFRPAETQVIFAIDHPGYQHMAVLPEAVRLALSADFDT